MTNMSDMFWILVAVAFFVPEVAQNKQCSDNPCFCCKSGSCEDPASHPYPCRGCISGRTGSSCHEPCPETCVNCSQLYFEFETDKICYQCKNGYYNGRYKDVPTFPLLQDCSLSCLTGCESCSSFHSCTYCKASFFMDSGGECSECPENCYQCTSEKSCSLCRDSHVWNGQFCKQCKPNCKLCTVNGECTECNSEYYVFGGECLRCQAGCQTCNDRNVCTECKTGFYIQSNKCIACKDNCLTCALNYQLGYTCKECVEGFYKSNENCEKCPSGCASCDTSTRCKKCDRYHKLHDGVCYECPASCTACSDNNICISCTERHYYDSGKCLACREQCASCRSLDICMLCVNGYFGNLCSSQCPIYCTNNVCNKSTGHCIGCVDGYFKDADRICKKCPDHCSVCDSNKYCLECDTGYMGVYCEEKCRNCQPGTKCEKSSGYCFDGCRKGLTGKSCDELCESKCLSCDRSNPSKCEACAVDRYGSACTNLCSDKCFNITCKDLDGVCTHGCISGYWGWKCENNCTDNCTANGCLRSNGTCLHKRSETFSDEIQSGGMSVVLIALLTTAGAILLAALIIFGICMCKHQQKKPYEVLSKEDAEPVGRGKKSESTKRVEDENITKFPVGQDDESIESQEMLRETERLLNVVECAPVTKTNETCIILEENSSVHIEVDLSVPDEKSGSSQNTKATNRYTEEKSAESAEEPNVKDEKIQVGSDNAARRVESTVFNHEQWQKNGLNTHRSVKTANGSNDLYNTGKIENIRVDKKTEKIKTAEPNTYHKENTENELSVAVETTTEDKKKSKLEITKELSDTKEDKDQRASVKTRKKEDVFRDKKEKQIVDENSMPNENGMLPEMLHRKTQHRQNEVSLKHVQVSSETEGDEVNIPVKYENGSNVELRRQDQKKEIKSIENEKTEKNRTSGTKIYHGIRQEKRDRELPFVNKPINGPDAALQEHVEVRSEAERDEVIIPFNNKDRSNLDVKTQDHEKEVKNSERKITEKNEIIGPGIYLEIQQEKLHREMPSDDKSINGLDASQEAIPEDDSTKIDTVQTVITRVHIDQLAEEYRARDIPREFKQLQTIHEHDNDVFDKVEGAPDSINAVLINGFTEGKKYIVSLEPRFETCQDITDVPEFWNMVWQNDCGKIVVLNKISEQSKGSRYWPTDSRMYGNIIVKCLNELPVPDKKFKSRILGLTLTTGMEEKEIRHFDFSAWHDFEITQDSSKLVLDFWDAFRSTVSLRDGPTLVQCRGDIGSTGVFVAFDILVQDASTNDHVDVFDCVMKLRRQCPAMFQTEEQYRTLYEVLIAYIQTKTSSSTDKTVY